MLLKGLMLFGEALAQRSSEATFRNKTSLSSKAFSVCQSGRSEGSLLSRFQLYLGYAPA
jgi:hypothetical protein